MLHSIKGIRQVFKLLFGFNVLGHPPGVVTDGGVQEQFYVPINGEVLQPDQIAGTVEEDQSSDIQSISYQISYCYI